LIKLGNLLEQQLAELAQSISLDDTTADKNLTADNLVTNTLLGYVKQMREQSPHRRIKGVDRSKGSFSETTARSRRTHPPPSSDVRTTSPYDLQPNVFVPTLYDVGTKDSRSIMDVAVFRLSKKNKRAGDIIHYTLPDGHVIVSAGAIGMASVWDYDIVLMAVSHLTEAMNRYREGKGEKPGRVFRPPVAEVLKFCRRAYGGKQKDNLLETCIRLNTTHVAVQRTRKTRDGHKVTVSEGETLISRYKVIKSESGRPEYIEIELADWMFREITEGKNPDVLTVHPDYFLIDPGIGRFVYRLARRAAGKGQAKWSFKTIFERSGSTGTFKKFAFTLRKLIEANNIPEYTLYETTGYVGPLLVMRHRDAPPNVPSASIEKSTLEAGDSS
jgi:plasmid replication initiation protein